MFQPRLTLPLASAHENVSPMALPFSDKLLVVISIMVGANDHLNYLFACTRDRDILGHRHLYILWVIYLP